MIKTGEGTVSRDWKLTVVAVIYPITLLYVSKMEPPRNLSGDCEKEFLRQQLRSSPHSSASKGQRTS